MKTNAQILADLTDYIATHPPTRRRPLSDDEIRAEEFWESIAEKRADVRMSDRDADLAALRYENARGRWAS